MVKLVRERRIQSLETTHHRHQIVVHPLLKATRKIFIICYQVNKEGYCQDRCK